MQHVSMRALESIRNEVMAQVTKSDGSIMYVGSEGNTHYFKAKASRRIISVTAELDE